MNTLADIILSERKYFVDTLRKLDSKQWSYSTLCEGWTIADLAAHLLVRERGSLVARAGIVLPFLHQFHDKAIARTKLIGKDKICEKLATPPGWVPRLGFNCIEFFVHNEDLLRGKLQRKRDLDEDLERALASFIPTLARFSLRRIQQPMTITLKDTRSYEEYVQHCGKKTSTQVLELEISGTVGELVLLLNGRGASADIKLSGSPEALEVFQLSNIGM